VHPPGHSGPSAATFLRSHITRCSIRSYSAQTPPRNGNPTQPQPGGSGGRRPGRGTGGQNGPQANADALRHLRHAGKSRSSSFYLSQVSITGKPLMMIFFLFIALFCNPGPRAFMLCARETPVKVPFLLPPRTIVLPSSSCA
jgi:hypothetical protein